MLTKRQRVASMLGVAAALVLALAALAACAAVQASSKPPPAKASGFPGAVPYPDGFDWPIPSQLEIARDKIVVCEKQPTEPGCEKAFPESRKVLRHHGWWLFAGVNQASAGPGSVPVWRTWPTSTPTYSTLLRAAEAGAAARSAAPRTLIQANADNMPGLAVNIEDVPLYPVPYAVCEKYYFERGKVCPPSLPDGPAFQNNGDIMIAGVIYNEDAYAHIRRHQLYLGSELSRLEKAATGIPGLPLRSFVLKHMYWPIQGDAYSALPVWRRPDVLPADDSYWGYETWAQAVAVAPDSSFGPQVASATYLHGVDQADGSPLGPITFLGPEVVPLDGADGRTPRFYYQTFDQAALDALDPRDQALLDQSMFWAYGRLFKAGDSIASIAMHINTREIEQWAFHTYWWSDQARDGFPGVRKGGIPRPYELRPDDVPGPDTWRNYMMLIEYELLAGNLLPPIYNPYIELVIHPVRTNCRNCHRRAAWPSCATGEFPHAAYQASPDNQTEGHDQDPGLLADLQPTDPIFDDLLLLDFQWAMSDRAHIDKPVSCTDPAAP